MSGFEILSPDLAKQVGQKLEYMAKSFAAGYQGLSNAGRTGVSALAVDQLDPVLRSITMEDKDFLISKDIPTIKSTQTVYMYTVKTQVRSGIDLAGFEAFLPQEDTSQYIKVAEILKVYGIRKSITQLAQLVNDVGGYTLDLEKENDVNAAISMAEAMERSLYVGGDGYIDSNGNIDATIASNPNANIREIRGITANIREGDSSARGIPGDFVGYGNNRSVLFNKLGGVLDRAFLDRVVTAVRDSRGAIKEGHCTTSQLAEFRSTFFPFERGDLGAAYNIRGASVDNTEQTSLPIMTVGGSLDMIPTVFKYTRFRPEPVYGSVGFQPEIPTGLAASTSTITGSGFAVSESYSYSVQAVNMYGMSPAFYIAAPFSIATADRAVSLAITLPAGNKISELRLFRSPKEASGDVTKTMFIGKLYVTPGQTSATFIDKNKLIPGLDNVLFLPRDKNRAKLAVIGNLLNKLELGLRGLAKEWVYSSYYGCVVDRPRTFAIIDNVYQQREGL